MQVKKNNAMKHSDTKGIYTAKQCKDINDVDIAMDQILTLIHRAETTNKPVVKLHMRLNALRKLKTKFGW